MTDHAYFRRQGDLFEPLPPTRGYWSPDSIHGSALVGLIGHEIERRHGGDGLVPVRFNVDMHRLTRAAPVEVATSEIRAGGRLRLVEARLLIDGTEYARAQCQFLRPAEHPAGRVWPGLAPWQAPSPDALAPIAGDDGRRGGEWRLIAGGIGHYGPRQMWMRQTLDLVAGEPLTPFSRVAAVADVTSPWLHSGESGIRFVNSDVVVQLHRLPEGEWIGLENAAHDGSQGFAIGFCRLYDAAGPIGFVSATALANTPRAGGASIPGGLAG